MLVAGQGYRGSACRRCRRFTHLLYEGVVGSFVVLGVVDGDKPGHPVTRTIPMEIFARNGMMV